MRTLIFMAAFCLASAVAARGQDDVIARARAAAADGRRAEGLSMLETHLASAPRDVDARLVYGLILSWDGRYDEARIALQAVLAQAPEYLDARVALMNVEWWAGRLDEARVLVSQVLAREPGQEQARLVKQRLDAKTRPWEAEARVTRDTFADTFDPWLETALSVTRETPAGSVIVRGSLAERFDDQDQQVEVEFYPTFRAGTYAFVGVGFASDQTLYPEYRLSFDFYQSLGRGFEVSGGYRRLEFTETTHVYLGTLTKYLGNWMFTGKAYATPDPGASTQWTYHAQSRRYFGARGTSYVGAGYSYGFSREEPRGQGDLLRLDAHTLRAWTEADVSDLLQIQAGASTSRQERQGQGPQWQTTLAAGLAFRF